MYELVESYEQSATIEVGGRTMPFSCLVQDEDGIRILIHGDPVKVRAALWARAHTDGASAIIIPDPFTSGYLCATIETFIERRREDARDATYSLGSEHWAIHDSPPSYAALRAAERQGAAMVADVPEALQGFVHLHVHSEYSALDGLSKIKELAEQATADNQGALAITDHGVCAAHPELQKVCKDSNLHPIFGIEANFTDDRFLRGDPAFAKEPEHHLNGRRILNDYRHLILWAETDQGLKNLWAMSTEANRTGFYGRPRMDWEVLERFAEGVMCSTACLRGPLARPLMDEDEDRLLSNLARLQRIFDGRLWVELGTNQMPEQKLVNTQLVTLAHDYGLPTIAVVDSHYPCATDQHTHRVWLASHMKKSLADDAELFAGEHEYHLMTEAEVRRNLSYLPADVVDQAVSQTLAVAERCKAQVRAGRTMPVFSKKGGADEDRRRAVDVCMEAWDRKITQRGVKLGYADEDVYIARFEREAKLLTDKGYWGYYLVNWDQTAYAKKHGVLVGPGRGSGAGSLISYLMGITEIDPIEAGLMFERFLTEGRDSPPDFDTDYPSSKRDMMQDYCSTRWGDDHTLRVGTVTRLKNKGAVRDVAAALKDTTSIHFPDIDAISDIIDQAEAHSAGLGIPWAELWEQHADTPSKKNSDLTLEVARRKYPELFDLAERLVGRVKSYGRHAAGMVISTDEALTGQLPLRASENSNHLISEFDMKALEMLGLLKFDILTLRTLDTLQLCLDLVKEHYGTTIDLHSWTTEYEDPMVWDELCAGHTLGVFQIETPAGTRLTKEFQPRSIAHLADVITLVRPGPKNSGLTASYMRRKAGQEPITIIDPRLEPVLSPTYGIIAYQEQVMAVCQVLAGYTLAEADEVRRLMGKKEVEKVQAAGQEFVTKCVANGVDRQVAEDLWDKLKEFAKYSFNKSHAWAYAMLGFWTAWFKVHYPSMFLTAVFSTVDQARIPEFVYEARRMGYSVLPPDVNESGQGFRPVGGTTVRYGLEQIKGIGEAVVAQIIAGQPYTSYDDFEKRSGVASDKRALLVRCGAFDSIEPHRRQLEARLDLEKEGAHERCSFKDETALGPNGLPCRFDWSSEPVAIGKSGKALKAKPPPARCTKGCRQYAPKGMPDLSGLEDYTEADIRERERELLGMYLSSTPFDRIHPDDLDACLAADEFDQVENGTYEVAAIVARVRQHKDRNGKEMAFVTLDARNGTIDCVVFKDVWAKYRADIRPDRLCLAVVEKTNRGAQLAVFVGL
jgi:DNA polymerase-3 subunit alpha